MKNYSEQQEQVAVANYLKVLGKLFTINAYSGMNYKTACKIKASGYAAGCPDIMIFEPSGTGNRQPFDALKEYYGLFIELKRSAIYGESKVSPEQRQWKDELNKRGYKAVICIGAQSAYAEIDRYFDIKK